MFGSDRQNAAGLANVFSQSVDGTGAAVRMTTSLNLQVPMTVTPDGTTLVFRETTSTA